jgi:hypothetical protein
MSIEDQRRFAWAVEPVAIHIGMDAGDLEDLDVAHADLLQQVGEGRGGPSDFLRGEPLRRDTGDSSELDQYPFELLELEVDTPKH